ncbi:MAG: IS21-like element helper ATPase IstB [Candidatus Paceibacterota bacterium]|jgi:DNA replication protein DnaC
MSSYVQLLDNLDRLKLTKIKEYLPRYLDENVAKEMSFTEALKELTEKELAFREERASAIGLKKSRFPYQKGIRDFDFGYQPSISKAQILDFSTLRFLETADNILFIGSSGVGKTHLATAIGIEASRRRVSTYFIHFTDLIAKMKRAYAESRPERVIKHFARYKLLIIDEIGYLPIEKEYSNLFFQLIANRYEHHSTIITTNQPLSKWGEVFGDPTIATAIIDRLVHHSSIVKITGRSYRIKDKIITEEPETFERGKS